MDKTFTFSVNGQRREVTTDAQRSLLEVLREDLQLTGAKYGCGEGQCRACTVLVNGKSVAACITSIADVHEGKILTIEGLAAGDKLHPVQEAFLAEGAFQCGYCTAGMILGVVGLLNEKPKPTEAEVLTRMQKHLCRCCSYHTIRSAIGQNGAGAALAFAAPEFGFREVQVLAQHLEQGAPGLCGNALSFSVERELKVGFH